LFSKCPNSRLVQLLFDEWENLEYFRVSTFRYVPHRAKQSVEEHDRLVALIEVQAEDFYIESQARNHRDRKSTRLNSSHVSLSYCFPLALHDALPISLFSKCPNSRLVQLLFDEWENLEYFRVSTFRYVPHRAKQSVEEHDRLVALIEVQAEDFYIESQARNH